MDRLKSLIAKKPRVYVLVTLAYTVLIVGARWLLHPSFDAVWFIVGTAFGIYFLDIAEDFAALTPSPFRSVIFFWLFIVVSFFVVTSSSVIIGTGLVLSLYLQMLMWQFGEFKMRGNTDTWYRMLASPVPPVTQRWFLWAAFAVFLWETIIVIR